LGIAGLVGAGRTEIARAIFGLDKKDSGEIYLENKKINIKTPKDAIRHGIVMASEDRKLIGLVLCRSVKENISLPNLKKFVKYFFLRKKEEKETCIKSAEELNIKINNINQTIINLSGGNQQKVVLSKWLMRKPKVMILDEPTRGIDVGAKAEIHRIISTLAGEGMSVILISSEMPELIAMCDRILVVKKGTISREFERTDILAGKTTQEDILRAAI
jgi:ABC-type sugar transport system ATPase subunit